jgi:hypothetical protein
MVKQMDRVGWRSRRKKNPRIEVELTLDEYSKWRDHLKALNQAGATRLRKLILDDLERPNPN